MKLSRNAEYRGFEVDGEGEGVGFIRKRNWRGKYQYTPVQFFLLEDKFLINHNGDYRLYFEHT